MLNTINPLTWKGKVLRLSPFRLIPDLIRYYRSVSYFEYSSSLRQHTQYLSLYQSLFLNNDPSLLAQVIESISSFDPEVHQLIPSETSEQIRDQYSSFIRTKKFPSNTMISASGVDIPSHIYKTLSQYFVAFSNQLPLIHDIIWVPTFIDILYGYTNRKFSSYLWHFDNIRPGHLKCLVSLSPSLVPNGISCISKNHSLLLKNRFPFLAYPRFNHDFSDFSPVCYSLEPGKSLLFNTHNLHKDETSTPSDFFPRCWASTQFVAVHPNSSNLMSLYKAHAECLFEAEGLTLEYLSNLRNA